MAEHLRTSSDAVVPLVDIPYVCKDGFEVGDFESYPSRQGYEFTDNGFLRIEEDGWKDLPRLLQEWLYFGLLEKIFGHPINVQFYVRTVTSSGQQFIHTMALQQMLRDWRFNLSQLDDTNKTKRLKTIMGFLGIAITQFIHMDQDSDWSRVSPLPEILFSISILLDTLIRAVAAHDSRIIAAQLLRPLPPSGTLPSTSILLKRMTQNRWCPHQVRLLSERFTPTIMFHLASLPPRFGSQDHSNCDKMDQCVADNVDIKIYQCVHVVKGCDCRFLSPPNDQVKAIIRAGEIPLISISCAASGEHVLSVISATEKTKYTAISHVWADGLGNPERNALPACQIKLLVSQVLKAEKEAKAQAEEKKKREAQKKKDENKTDKDKKKEKVRRENQTQKEEAKIQAKGIQLQPQTQMQMIQNNIPYAVNVWMDTLCIPVDDEHLKMKAVSYMTPTYKRATRVLVLDSGLSAVQETVKPWDMCAHLLMSPWNRRTWTLQEGALASDISFPLYHDEDLHLPESMDNDYIWKELHAAHQLPSVGAWKNDDKLSARERQFVEVWNALLGRTTTKPEDAHGIVANLLDYNAEEILLLDKKNRMKAILCDQDRLPIGLLYDRSVRSLVNSPFDRWLPDFPKGNLLTKNSWMDVTPEGLYIGPYCVWRRTILVSHESRTIRPPQYCLDIEGIGKFVVNHQVIARGQYLESLHEMTLLHLERRIRNSQDTGLATYGASFAVLKRYEDGDGKFCVVYDDPVTLEPWESASKALNVRNWLCLKGKLLDQSDSILIDIVHINHVSAAHQI